MLVQLEVFFWQFFVQTVCSPSLSSEDKFFQTGEQGMTNEQKENVRKMRGAGASYAKIADALGLSENTVQSFCRRNNLTGGLLKAVEPNSKAEPVCLNCGAPIKQTPGYRGRKYCSDRCRIAWWNKHPTEPGRTNIRMFTCLTCKKQAAAYGKRERKYCSRSCSGRSKAGGR